MYAIFFFNDTATTEIYTLSLHDALPILGADVAALRVDLRAVGGTASRIPALEGGLQAINNRISGLKLEATPERSEEHTSELQSRQYLVCRLLLEKKKHPGRSSRA